MAQRIINKNLKGLGYIKKIKEICHLSDYSRRTSGYAESMQDRNEQGVVIVDCFNSDADTLTNKGSRMSRKMTLTSQGLQSETTVRLIKAQINKTEERFIKAADVNKVIELNKVRELSKSKGRKNKRQESPDKNCPMNLTHKDPVLDRFLHSNDWI